MSSREAVGLPRLAVDLVAGPSVLARMTTWCRWGHDHHHESQDCEKFELAGWSNCFTLKPKFAQEAIKQLRERGEKVTAFVVIAVAKQVGGRFAK